MPHFRGTRRTLEARLVIALKRQDDVFLARRGKRRYSGVALRKTNHPTDNATVDKMARSHQIIVYLSEDAAKQIRAGAVHSHMSASAYAKVLIDRELKRQSAANTPASHTLEAIQIAVDALVKNHPNTKLFEVVTAVRADRLKRASHEA